MFLCCFCVGLSVGLSSNLNFGSHSHSRDVLESRGVPEVSKSYFKPPRTIPVSPRCFRSVLDMSHRTVLELSQSDPMNPRGVP